MTDVTSRPTERERQHALIVEQAVELDRLRRSNKALLEACKTTLHWLRNRPADEVIPLVSRIVAAIKEAENG